MTASPETLRIVPAPTALSTAVGEDVVILDTASSTYYTLNAVGARIWLLAQQGLTLNDIRAVLLDDYAVEAPQLDADIREFLRQTQEWGLITVAPAVP